jgi:hypothetical protein
MSSGYRNLVCNLVLAEAGYLMVESKKRILDKQKAPGFVKPGAFCLFNNHK